MSTEVAWSETETEFVFVLAVEVGDGGGLEETLYVSRREKTINNGSY